MASALASALMSLTPVSGKANPCLHSKRTSGIPRESDYRWRVPLEALGGDRERVLLAASTRSLHDMKAI
jgi:hypothetical protein